jgi:hypothetical protein
MKEMWNKHLNVFFLKSIFPKKKVIKFILFIRRSANKFS